MKEKNLPEDINSKSLNDLTELAQNIIQNLESEKNLERSINEYQKLIKLNNLIEKKFQNNSKNISNKTKDKRRNDQIINLLNSINPIIQEYMNDNSISMVIDKKNVYIANKKLDITNNLIELINKKIK